MDIKQLREDMAIVENVQVEEHEGKVVITNGLEWFSLEIECQDIDDRSDLVMSPYREFCMQLFLKKGGFVIVAPKDFIYDLPEMEHVKFKGMPPVAVVTDMMRVVAYFRKDMEKLVSVDSAMVYVRNRHMIKTGIERGLTLEGLLERLDELAEELDIKEAGKMIEMFNRGEV
ncbi:MAG: hypothetical protein AB2L14_10155 [Candidatus Xenobiia bacterium LiM19]